MSNALAQRATVKTLTLPCGKLIHVLGQDSEQ